ncbi:MAG: hypothetical protein GY906_19755 [bacterium]|nr:hypothetical protein [bacterium]
MSKARNIHQTAGWVLLITIAVVFGLAVESAEAQVFTYDRLVYDGTGGNTTGFFCNTRPHRGEPFSWGGKDFLLANIGTDVSVYKLDSPGSSPVTKADLYAGLNCLGFFDENPPVIPFGPPVEIEWLEGHGKPPKTGDIAVKTQTLGIDGVKEAVICDECRYAVVDANNYSVILDLGTPTSGSEPDVIGKWLINDEIHVTYKVGSIQYLLGDRGTSCGEDLSVWTISPGPGSLPQVELDTCLPSDFPDPGAGEVAHAGNPTTGAGAFVIFRAEAGDNQVYLADVSGATPQIVGSSIQSRGDDVIAVDLDQYPNGDGYLLVVDLQGDPSIHRVRSVAGVATVSMLSGLEFPGANWGIGTLTVGSSGDGYVYLSTAEPPLSTTRGLFRLSDLDTASRSAVEIDHAYWNDTQSDFNQAATKPVVGKDLGATFDRDGNGLFLFRYWSLIHMKYNGPAAGVSIDNTGIIYPGTLVELSNASTNWDTARGWVTAGSSPDDPEVHSSGGFSPSLTSFDWATDPAFDCTVDYWVHVQINGETGPMAKEMIPFECSPQVDLVAPLNALTHSEPTLTADAPGFEHNSSDYDYTWEIWYPGTQTNDPADDTIIGGDQISPLLDTGGLWNFRLTVAYDHWNEWNGPDPVFYEDSSSIKAIDVSGLAPDIGYLPASPTVETGITLNAGDSEAVEGLTGATYTFSVDGVPVTGCSGALVWSQGSVQIPDCVVPEGFIEADTEQVAALTLSANEEVQDKTATINFTVQDYSFAFSFSPISPDRGQEVTFDLTEGSPSDIHRWEFGNQSSGDGEDCNGFRDYVCNGNPMFCGTVPWSFKNDGAHEVRIYDLNNVVVATETITVNPSGSCPIVACTSYSIDPPRNWGVEENGGDYSINVTGTPSGCELDWTASESLSWVIITSTTTSSVDYSVDPYDVVDGSRIGTMSIAGKGFEILQVGPIGVPSGFDFSISDTTPDKGQEVVFSLTDGSPSEVSKWEFGDQFLRVGENCDGYTEYVCNGDPVACATVSWRFKNPGTHQVRVFDLDDQVVAYQDVTVSTSGQCPGSVFSDGFESGNTDAWSFASP